MTRSRTVARVANWLIGLGVVAEFAGWFLLAQQGGEGQSAEVGMLGVVVGPFALGSGIVMHLHAWDLRRRERRGADALVRTFE